MKFLVCISFILVFLSQNSLPVECGEKIKHTLAETNDEPILEKSLSDELQKALNELPVENIPSVFNKPKGDE